MMRRQGLECIICFNKRDIASKEERAAIRTIYENSGCTVLFASAMKKEGMEEIAAVLKDRQLQLRGRVALENHLSLTVYRRIRQWRQVRSVRR